MTELGYPYTKPRAPIGAMYTSPGPIYMLPPLIGEKSHDMRSTFVKAPSYSLAKQLKDIGNDRSPGPAAYAQNSKLTNTGEAGTPKYTITGIPKPLKFGLGPGPADYDVDPGRKLVFPGTPAHLMAQRLPGRRTDDTPAPNAYTLPDPSRRSEIPSAPNYTMAGRNDSQSFILNKNPGPADYTVGAPDLCLTASPKYTMGITLPERSRAKMPGPLSYKAEMVKSHLPSTPKFTMGIKHSQYKGEFAVKYADDF
ncbi:hypothetical protein EG68_09675 [Paragonimus skrjabini miyazakii]|uniref:Outer dense fiber protein 3 n=1 Tax=Paragonimus skrjabini miyazakii TaxID=59628 RepID=A0A8S9YF38_9TREM|nr:hypothetical protein EG68_09675 [Paragonimus skrjabini miyazakii]